jgi:predicted nuclease of predicted toxin-antitoxin system
VIIWIDAQLSPALAPWIMEQFSIESYSMKWLGYRDALDKEIFHAARAVNAVVMTKDQDFIGLLDQHGPPPQIIWITLGNTSNARMKEVLQQTLLEAVKLLKAGEPLVEIGGHPM